MLNTPTPLHFITLDPFGEDVMRELRSLIQWRNLPVDVTSISRGDSLLSESFMGQIVVLASAIPSQILSRTLNADAYKHKFQFVPITIESSILQIGPRVIPSLTPCWVCWNERVTSQHGSPDERLSLLKYCDQERHAFQMAFMPSTSVFAAFALSEMLSKDVASRDLYGTVWMMNIFTREVSLVEYIGRHGCPQCHVYRGEDKERSIAGLHRFIMKRGDYVGGM